MIPEMKEMITLAKSGDESAMRSLIEEHQGGVYGFLYKMLGSRESAEDATQDALVKVAKGIGNYEDNGTFKAWVYRIAKNVGLDHLRSKKRRGGELSPLMDTEQDIKTDVRQDVEQRERCELAFSLLEKLPAPEREVMTLRVAEGLKFKEIAEVTDAPLNTVLGRMRNATLKLKQWMEEIER